MKGFRELIGLNESTGLTGLGGLMGFISANQAASNHGGQKSQEPRPLLKNVCVTLLAFAVMGFFALIMVKLPPLNPLTDTLANFSFTDIYYSVISESGTPVESKTVTIVDINQLEGRGNYADLLEEIESMHPAVICVDAVFEGVRLYDQEGDMQLADVVAKYDNIVFSMKMEELHTENNMWVSTASIHSYFTEFVDVREAFCNMPRGNLYDSMKREIPIAASVDSVMFHSMIVETVNTYARKDVTEGRNDAVKINYSPTSFPSLKPVEVKAHRELIEDRIVLLGDLHDQYDQHWSPLGEKLAGVSILAYGIQTMLDKKEVVKPHWTITCLLSFLVVLMMLYIINLHARWTKDSKNLVVRFLLGSDYARGLIIFASSSLLLMVSFLIFMKWNLSLSWGWAFSGVAFLSTAGNLYKAIRGYYLARKEKQDETVVIEAK